MTQRTEIGMARIAKELFGDRFRDELRTSWATALIYRAPSVPLVWLAARAGLRPTAVTLAALALALTLPVQAAALPLHVAGWAVAASGALFQMLDYVDGTLARVTGRTSARGAVFDFLTDMAQWGLLYLAIGILADRTLGTGWGWTALAAGAAWTRLLARVVRDALPAAAGPARAVRPFDLPVILVTGLSGLIPFLALLGPALGLAVWFLLVYALLDLGDALLVLRNDA